jgi:hypothetical protein
MVLRGPLVRSEREAPALTFKDFDGPPGRGAAQPSAMNTHATRKAIFLARIYNGVR